MLTTRTAFACVLSTCLLLSCNNKNGNKGSAKSGSTPSQFDTVQVLQNDPLNIDELNKGFAGNAAQQFTASAKKISVIKGEKGLKVTINPSALELEDGTAVEGKIDVTLIELTTTNDLFKSNAATMCNGRLLASGGSYFIGMENNGQKVRIKNGHTIQIDFPVIADEEMELFYGERNNNSNMNWKRAGASLVPKQEERDLIDVNNMGYDVFPAETKFIRAELTLYRSLHEKVYYYNKRMTVQQLVDTLNRNSKKVFLETVYTWPKSLDTLPKGTWVDTAYLLRIYGPAKQYYIKTYKSLQDENERLARLAAQRDSMLANWHPQSLVGQIQKYYQPSAITALGWINCDRFYQYKQQTDVELDLPITLNGSKIQFFLIFKSFNGLMNYNVDTVGIDKSVFRNLPVGEPVTIIGFSKAGGQIFQCKEDFIIVKNKTVALSFKNVSPGEMTKMFGKNVRI